MPLLLAPKSRAETRAYLKAKFSDIGEKVGDKVSNIRHKMGEIISGEECAPTKEEG